MSKDEIPNDEGTLKPEGLSRAAEQSTGLFGRRSPFTLALTQLLRLRWLFVAAILWRAAFVLVPMQAPILAGAIVDGLNGESVSFYGFEWPADSGGDILRAATLGLILLALACGVSSYAQMITGAKLGRRFVLGLRSQLAAKLMRLSVASHHSFGSGDLLERVIGDAGLLRQFITRVFLQSLTNLVRIGYPIAMLVVIDRWMALAALCILPPQLLISRYLLRQLHLAKRQSRQSQSALTSAVKETLDGIETLKTLPASERHVDAIHAHAARTEEDELAAHRFSSANGANVWLLTSLGVALAWWMGASRVMAGDVMADKMTVGLLIEFIGFQAFAYRPFRQFTTIASTFRSGLVSLERIQEVLDTPETIPSAPHLPALRAGRGTIELQGVTFSYSGSDPGREVFQALDLVLPAGVCTAVVGPSGSGKSSLIKLLARIEDPSEGHVRIDGQSLREVALESVRHAVAVVPQQPIVFHGTIAENVALGNPSANRKAIIAACKGAGASRFIERLPQGYDTQVGPEEGGLSGGQAQRLAIARAIVSQPKILLMDEPTAALDGESEGIVLETLQKLRGKMTVVLIGHRDRTIASADHIVVLEAGKVLAQGTHEQLRLECDRYNQLFDWKSSIYPIPAA